MFPYPILQHIFQYLSLPDKLRASRVSRKWYYLCMDPHLYQHVELKDLEFNTLIEAMKSIVRISPRIKSIKIDGCYSEFIKNTVIPIQFSTQNKPLLYSQIRTLQPSRRRQEYLKLGFELNDLFSDLFAQILELGRSSLHAIKIINCNLDFEMTELFCSIACHGQSLEIFHYVNNGDKGLHSSGLLQAIVSGCPNMRRFNGAHAGMNDTVLMSMTRHWPRLESLTLSNIKSNSFSNDHEPATISGRTFWELLVKCKQLRTLELEDLSCITNSDLTYYNSLLQQSASKKIVHRYKPYDTQHRQKNEMPGLSLKNLKITKYTTLPLTTPGFLDLLKLFPNLESLEYATNYHTFNNQFEGVTCEMYQNERAAVATFMKSQNLLYNDQWNQPVTMDQLLLAGANIRM